MWRYGAKESPRDVATYCPLPVQREACVKHSWRYVCPAVAAFAIDAPGMRPERADWARFVSAHVVSPDVEARPRALTAVHGGPAARRAEVPLRWRRADCDSPNVFRCVNCPEMASFACSSKDADKCAPCEGRYRKAVRFLVRGPMKVARPRSSALVTVTAPGAKRHCVAHPYRHSDGVLRPSVRCVEGDGRSHSWCPCGEDGHRLETREDIAQWNPTSSSRANRFINNLQRGSSLKGGRGDFERSQYFRAMEPQKRGAIHFHIVFRVPGVLVVDDELRAWVSEQAVAAGFGHEVDIQVIGDGDLDHVRAARYVAKYVTKSNATSSDVAMPAALECGCRKRGAVLAEWENKGIGKGGKLLAARRGRYVPSSVHEDSCAVPERHALPRRPRSWTCSRRWGLSLGVIRSSQRLFAAGLVEDSRMVLCESYSRAGLGMDVGPPD